MPITISGLKDWLYILSVGGGLLAVVFSLGRLQASFLQSVSKQNAIEAKISELLSEEACATNRAACYRTISAQIDSLSKQMEKIACVQDRMAGQILELYRSIGK